MAKKREFASDSDVSRFITRKQNHSEEEYTEKRQQFTIYPDKELLEQVKILAKIQDTSMNDIILKLLQEALTKPDYQKLITVYQQMKALL